MATQHSDVALIPQEQHVATFQQLEDYAWDSDPEFQGGLQAILGSNSSTEQAEHLTLRARCFYFARKNNIPIDFNAYHTWRSQQSSSLANGMSVIASASDPFIMNNSPPRPESTSRNFTDTSPGDVEPPAPYPTSFSQLVELITSGELIPGIKEVPNTVLEGQASQPTTAKRKKPWEKDDASTGEEVVGTNNSLTNIA